MLGEGDPMLMEQGKPPRGESNLIPRRVLAALLVLAVMLLHPQPAPADPPTTGDSSSFRLLHADATVVVPQLRQMLSEYGARAELLIEKSQNRIVVRGPEADRQLAGQLIGTLDKVPAAQEIACPAGEMGKVVGYPVAPDRIDAVAEGLRKKFASTAGVRIAPDRRTSQLVVIASPDAHVEIANYLQGSAGSRLGRPLGCCRRPAVADPPTVCRTSPHRNSKRAWCVYGAVRWRSPPTRPAKRPRSPWPPIRRGRC